MAGRLAKAGFEVLLFDHQAPWDKPCAGGITPPNLEKFPELAKIRELGNPIHQVRVITFNNESNYFDLRSPIYVLPRKPLAEFLLDQALSQGAIFFSRKIADLFTKSEGWVLKDDRNETLEIDFLVGADGVHSRVRRKFCPPWPKLDYIFSLSFWVSKKVSLPLTFKLFPGVPGYAWIFPGKESASLGIGVKNLQLRPEKLLALWEELIGNEPELKELKPVLQEKAKKWLVPALSFSKLRNQKVAGENWALVGDASGAVNSVNGEGIPYAFQSASLLAEALISGRPEAYQQKWWEMCKAEIAGPSIWSPIFYNSSCQKQLSKMLAKSDTARNLVTEILSGGRPKRTRILTDLLRSLAESL